jgi:hypothetical protein
LYRDLRIALDLCTVTPREEAVVQAVARPEAVEATTRMKGLLQHPNVVAVGIAEKQRAGQGTGSLALTFYVDRKLDRVPSAQAVPEAIPAAIAGRALPTDVVQIGQLRPEVQSEASPIQPGFSIGHPDVTAGTLGAVLGPASSPRLLSNSHVLANSGHAAIGDAILYPGSADNGQIPKNVVGRLTQVIPFVVGGQFVNHMDVATATIDPKRLADLQTQIPGLGITPSGTTVPKRGMTVVKVGRTTGLTRGVVNDINFRFVLPYDDGSQVGYLDQVFCTRYSQGGDSGSLVLDDASHLAVGLHFAGAQGGSVFSPIRPILRAVHARFLKRAPADN